MNETKFTPGPWGLIRIEDRGPDTLPIVQAEGIDVAWIRDGWDKAFSEDTINANANLIAVAPELYEAAQRAWAQNPNCLRDEVGASKVADCHCIACSLKAALAKARGEVAP